MLIVAASGDERDQLAKLRLALGLSTSEVDRRAGWPAGTCRNLESVRVPSYERLQAWKRALGAENLLVPAGSSVTVRVALRSATADVTVDCAALPPPGSCSRSRI